MQGTLACEDVSTEDTLVREYVSTQGTLAREQISTQGTYAREHVSKQGTLTREHVFSTQGTQFSRLILSFPKNRKRSGISLPSSFLKKNISLVIFY